MSTIEYKYRLDYKFVYGLDDLYPAIDVQLSTEHGLTSIVAILDTGAMRSVFSGEYLEALGLDSSSGKPIRFSTLAGGLVVREFPVKLQLLDKLLELNVCSSEQTLRRNILGRDVLDKLQVGF